MALRMSSMLRTAGDVRGTRPTAPSKEAKLHKEEPLPEGLPALEETADVAAPVPRSDAEIYKRFIGVAEQVFAAACSGETPDENAIVRALRTCMNTLREGESLLAETMRRGGAAPGLPQRPQPPNFQFPSFQIQASIFPVSSFHFPAS